MRDRPHVGTRVRATGGYAHSETGRVRFVPECGRAAIVTFDCGCAAYVPLAALTRVGAKVAAPSVAANPATVTAPAGGKEPPFDSKARPGYAGTSALQPRGGRAAIDGRGTNKGLTPLRREQAARPGQRAAEQDGRGARKPGGTGPREGVPTSETGSTPASSTHRMAGRGTGVPRPASAGKPGALPGSTGVGRATPPEPPAAPVVKRAARPVIKRPPGRPVEWTAANVVAAAHAWRRYRGRWPIASDWHVGTTENPSFSTVKRLFGGWLAFSVACGFESRHRKDWTRAQVVDAFKRYAREEGRSPSTAVLNRRARPNYCPCTMTVKKLFGSFPAGLAAAGLESNPVGRPPRVKAAA